MPPLGFGLGGLEQLEQDVLDILAHIARFGQRGGVGDGEGNIEDLGQGLREQRLAGAGRPDQQNIALLQFHIAAGRVDALVVVIDGDRQAALGPLLPDDILAEDPVDLFGFRHECALPRLLTRDAVRLLLFAADNVIAQIDAVQADAAMHAEDQFLDLFARLAAQHTAAIDPVESPLTTVVPPAFIVRPFPRSYRSGHTPALLAAT